MTLSKSKIMKLFKIHKRLLIYTKILRGATIGMLVHVTSYVENRTKIPNSFDEKIAMIMFCILVCPVKRLTSI